MPSGITDFLFGKKALEKASQTGDAAPPPPVTNPGISMEQIRRDAQAQADRDLKGRQGASIPSDHVNVKNPGTHSGKLEHE